MKALSGEIDLCEAADKFGIITDTFRKRLERQTRDFRNAMVALEHSAP
jgi:hypothetical protein